MSSDRQYQDDGMGAVWVLAMFVAIFGFVGYMVWSNFHGQIKWFTVESAMWLRYAQYPLIPVVSNNYAAILQTLPALKESVDPENISNAVFFSLLKINLRSLGLLIAVLVIPRGIYLILNHQRLSYTRTLTLDELIAIQREQYPRIKPATATNLLHSDPRFGPWASHFNPIELCIDKGLIGIESRRDAMSKDGQQKFDQQLSRLAVVGLKRPADYATGEEGITFIHFRGLAFPTAMTQPESEHLREFHDQIANYQGLLRLDHDKARSYFVQTLGPRCVFHNRVININYLPPPERALWMLLCACIAGRAKLRPRIEGLLDQMANSFLEGEFRSAQYTHHVDLGGIKELYDEVRSEYAVKLAMVDIAAQHAYYYTAFTRLYMLAKEAYGTIIARDIHWLKTVNRLLYFAINQIGLEAPRPEAASIRAHYLAEEKRGERIVTPCIETCLINLSDDLYIEGWLAVRETEHDEFGRAHWLGEAPPPTETEEDAA